MAIKHVIFDFDGTSTQVEDVQEKFLESYRRRLERACGVEFTKQWKKALAAVEAASPKAAWTTIGHAPAAPAYADPYIAAGEAVAWMERRWAEAGQPRVTVPSDLYKTAYVEHPAPFRPELAEVLEALVTSGKKVTFISNSATDTIGNRLTDALASRPQVREKITVIGHAGKFFVKELAWDAALPKAWAALFAELPVSAPGPGRPVYLRRGEYFQALVKACEAGRKVKASETMVVGDVYELDLALPQAIGCAIHMIERAAPFETYDYERDAVKKARGYTTADLTTLVERVAEG